MGKKLLVILVVVVLLSGLAACSGQTENPQQTDTTTTVETTKKVETTTKAEVTTTKTETTVENPFAEKMTINWLLWTYMYEEGRWDELEIEEKFNVDIKPWDILVDSKNMEHVYMMLAAGDVPDYGFYYRSGRYLYENGLGRTITLDMIKKFYPSFYEQMAKEPIGRIFNKVEGKDEYYGLTSFTCMATHTGHVPMWRLDWLEALGYEFDDLTPLVSTATPEFNDTVFFSDTKFTIDEVKELLRAFTEDDPDGNGADDTYGSPYSDTWYDGYISNLMFGYIKDDTHFYKDPVTGDFVPYYAYTPYKETIEYLMEMLDRGYIRKVPGVESWFTELLAIWKTGKTGFMNALSGSSILGYNGQAINRPPLSILSNDPEARFVITRCPGAGKLCPYWTFNWYSEENYPIGINVSDAKLERILQILEYTYFGENWMRYKFGIEGIHYTWAGEPMNSSIISTPTEKIPPKYASRGASFGQFGNYNFISDNKIYFAFDAFTNQFIDFYEKYNEGGYYNDNLWVRPDKVLLADTMSKELYDEFMSLKDTTIDQLNSVHYNFTQKMWDGQISNLDAEWEQYIEQLYAAGLEDWVEIWNRDDIKTYQEYNSMK